MRRAGAAGALVMIVMAVAAGVAGGEPLDSWQAVTGIDCTGAEVEAQPGTPEFRARDERNQRCASQRFFDRGFQPLGNTVPSYGKDPYREPGRSDGVRFRYSTPKIEGVPSLEVYRPCDAGSCADLPDGLDRYEPPYPVVIVVHGFTASKELHRMNTQLLAEAGYLTIGVNGTHPEGVSAPNSSSKEVVDKVVDWVFAGKGEAADADLRRVGMAGHSQGGGVTRMYQGDRRIKTMVIWDGGTTAAPENTSQPMLFQTAEGGFATPNAFDTFPDVVEAAEGYGDLRSRDVDTMAITGRATVHVDYNGTGGPGGNRLWEAASNYYNLAWFDRYLKGRLALKGVRGAKRRQAERRRVQRVAMDAFRRLRARRFDDSVDVHDISMGFWDPDKAAASGDPLYGGNVPYTIAGLPIADRLSFYYRHACFISVPDYVHGGTGIPHERVADARRADTTVDGDMRTKGCPLTR